MEMKSEKQIFKYIVCDWVAAVLSWTALFLFRKYALDPVPDTRPPWAELLFSDPNYWIGIVLVPMGWLILYTIQGAYRSVLRKARLKELVDTAVVTLMGVVIIFFLLLIDDNISTYRSHYLSFFFLLVVHFVITYTLRLLITSQTVRRVHNRQIGFPTLLIGSGCKAYHTYLDVENQETYSGNLFVGYVETTGQQDCETTRQRVNEATGHPAAAEFSTLNSQFSTLSQVMPCLGKTEDLRNLIEEYKVEEVIVALEEEQKHLTGDILRALNCSGDLIIKLTPNLRDFITGSIKQSSIFHSPFIVINNRLMEEWQYSLKRIADVIISIFAMLLLSPVYLVTAIIVKATSPGPVFYAQERIGLHGKPFRMHKFRSMYVDAEAMGPALSKDDDPRITPFGRFMRKVRLDEIPQFWNVLRGTMSIVGPRPERQFYIDQIVKRAPEYLLLQRIKPGITSWGQVKYGYASTVDEMVERLRYDLLYLDNMSIITDLKIMVYTAKIILQGRGK